MEEPRPVAPDHLQRMRISPRGRDPAPALHAGKVRGASRPSAGRHGGCFQAEILGGVVRRRSRLWQGRGKVEGDFVSSTYR
jgi:hypothetical protein